MKLPLWDRISDNGKQLLAVVAVLQAVHFVIAVPMGLYSGWRWDQEFKDTVQPTSRSIAAEHAIAAELWSNANKPFSIYAHRDDCLESMKDEFIYSPPTKAECDAIPTLREIVARWADIYAVPDDQVDDLLLSLEVLYGLPKSEDGYGLRTI